MENTNPAGENPASNNQQPVVPPAPAQKKGLSTGAIVAIVVGLFVLFIGAGAMMVIVPLLKAFEIASENGGTSIEIDDNPLDGGSSSSSYDSKGKCKFYECLTNVNADSTVSEVTTAFGFEPTKETKDGASFDTYTWTFDDDHTIEMTVSQSTGSTITIKLGDYNDEEIEKSGVTFANVQTIKSNLNVGDGVSYEKFKEYMGGVDGTLIEVGSWNKYEWRSTTEKGYISGSFSSDGKCMFMSGMTY